MKQADLIVIGSGAGTKVAVAAARLGLDTVLFEDGPMGGTCLNRGCIPSKMLIFPAALAERVRESAHIGIRHAGQVSVDLSALGDRIISETDAISDELLRTSRALPKLQVVLQRARFTGDREMEAGGERYAAPRVIIAAGAEPVVPDIPGLAGTPFMTSTDLLRNTRLPKRLLVVGAGYIACELGHAYGALGSQVIFLVRSRFLKGEDPDAAAAVEQAFKLRHQVYSGYQPVAVSHSAQAGFEVVCEGPHGVRETFRADALLIATGIRPCTPALNLAATGVACDDRGYIRTDSRLRTTAAGVWALGDIIGRHAFRHTANVEAEYLERTVLHGVEEGPLDYGPVPHAVFTRPEIGSVGLTEPDARAVGHAIYIARADYAEASNAGLARGLDEGFVKIILECGTDRILGAHVVGEEAATVVHLFIALMKKGGTLKDLRELIFIHPALPEVVRDAVRRLAPGTGGA
jgi:mycothione reductase